MHLRALGFSVPKTQLKIVLLSIATEFRVEGGCKLKVKSKNDFRRVWIITADGKHKSVVTRSKREGYQVSDGYWITGPKKIYINVWRIQADDEIATISADVDELGSS